LFSISVIFGNIGFSLPAEIPRRRNNLNHCGFITACLPAMAIPLFFMFVGPPEAQQSESLWFNNFLFAGHGDPLVFHLCGPSEAQQSEPLRFNHFLCAGYSDPLIFHLCGLPEAQQSESLRFYNCLFAGHGDPLIFHVCGASGGATI
jgi:hypothetical protein